MVPCKFNSERFQPTVHARWLILTLSHIAYATSLKRKPQLTEASFPFLHNTCKSVKVCLAYLQNVMATSRLPWTYTVTLVPHIIRCKMTHVKTGLVIWPATDGEAERSGDVPALTHIRWTNRGRPVVSNHFCNLSIPRRSPEGLSSFIFLLRLLPWFPMSRVWEQAICNLWLRKWATFSIMSVLLIVGVTCVMVAPAFLKTAQRRPSAHICSAYCPRNN